MPIFISRTLFGAAMLGAVAIAGCDSRPGEQTATTAPVRDDTTVFDEAGTMSPAADRPVNAATMDADTYVGTAASGDLFEIRSSELALELSKDETVRDFAERMIADHRNTSEALRGAAATAGEAITVPTAMMPRHMAMISELQQAGAGQDRAAFDTLYMNQQRSAHAEALELHSQMAERTDIPASLRTFATNTARKIEQHNVELTRMQPAPDAGKAKIDPKS